MLEQAFSGIIRAVKNGDVQDDQKDPVQLLSNGTLCQKNLMTDAIQCAMNPFLFPDLYNE